MHGCISVHASNKYLCLCSWKGLYDKIWVLFLRFVWQCCELYETSGIYVF